MSIGRGLSYEQQQVHYLTRRCTFADDDKTVSLGWLPANAGVIASGAHVRTAWNGDGADAVDIGFRASDQGATTDPDAFTASVISLDALGHVEGDTVATENLYFSAPAEVTATFTSAGSAPSAGEAYLYVTYIVYSNQDTLP